ncbi:MAG: F0F1 ATP synthase subunit C [Chloroflexota bacterium]
MNGAVAIGVFAGLAVIGIGLAALGSASGQGRAAASAMDAIARQPGAFGDIRSTLLVALAFMETLTLFVFAMILLLTFLIPAWVR